MHDSSAGPDVMTIELNHTIVYSRDKRVSSDFLAGLFGLPSPAAWGPFLAIGVANQVTLDFLDADGEIAAQHYCFLVGEDEFDEIFGRIQAQGLQYWADPGHDKPGEINTHDGGRGVYFDDPSGHILEIITRPYGEARGQIAGLANPDGGQQADPSENRNGYCPNHSTGVKLPADFVVTPLQYVD